MYFVYILYSEKFDRFYVGQCEDIPVRLALHNSGGVSSTKPFRPWALACKEEYTTRSEAMKREKELKSKKSRKYIEFLLTLGKI